MIVGADGYLHCLSWFMYNFLLFGESSVFTSTSMIFTRVVDDSHANLEVRCSIVAKKFVD